MEVEQKLMVLKRLALQALGLAAIYDVKNGTLLSDMRTVVNNMTDTIDGAVNEARRLQNQLRAGQLQVNHLRKLNSPVKRVESPTKCQGTPSKLFKIDTIGVKDSTKEQGAESRMQLDLGEIEAEQDLVKAEASDKNNNNNNEAVLNERDLEKKEENINEEINKEEKAGGDNKSDDETDNDIDIAAFNEEM